MFLGSIFACAPELDSADTAEAGPQWTVVGEGLSSALLSIWGTSWDDVWVVGADTGSDGVLMHWNGTEWSRILGLGAGDAWWIEGTETTLWISCAGGRILRYDLSTGAIAEDTLDLPRTMFGIWPASDTDAWAVGGDPDVGVDTAVLYHWNGETWQPAELPPEAAAAGTIFKVTGAASNDVWAVGNDGIALHYDGSSWTLVPTPVANNLFGIRGRYAVGGDFTATILAWNGGGFVEESPLYAYQFTGVSDDGEHTPTAVGLQGQIYLRGELGWEPDPSPSANLQDLHAVWIDPEGGSWAVGGHLSTLPLIHGALQYKGDRIIAPLESL